MGPTPIGNNTFFAAYLHLHSRTDQGRPTPLTSCWAVCAVGLIHWACQPNKESIYLVSEGPLSKDLAEDGGTGYPEKLWCVRLIRADTDSSTSSPPPPPPLPDDKPPEDEKRKDKPGGTPGPSELFRAMERLSSGLKGSTSQGGTTAPAPQSSSTLPQHNLGSNPDSAPANECGNKINIPPGFIDPAAHVGENVDFWEDYSSDDNSDDCVPPPPPPDSPPPPSPPGSPPNMQTCIPCGDPVVNLPTRPTPRRVTPLVQTESEIESIRCLKLTKEARDKEDRYEALHGENDRRIRKLNTITMAEDAELERQMRRLSCNCILISSLGSPCHVTTAWPLDTIHPQRFLSAHLRTATRMPLLSRVQRPSVVAVATSSIYRRSALKPGAPSRNANARSTSDRTYSLLTIFAVLTTPNWQINTVMNL